MNFEFITTILTVKWVFMFGAFITIFIVMAPSVSFFYYGWMRRRKQILSGVNSKEDEALKYFFMLFHSNFEDEENDLQKRFQKYYDAEFGRLQFILPMVIFLSICTLSINICLGWLFASKNFVLYEPVKAVGLFSVMGAYLWILNDQITRWWHSELSACNLYWASFRMLVSIPVGYAVARLVNDSIAPFIAFALGTFPTDTVFSIVKKLSKEKLGLAEFQEGKESQLLVLHGIDAANAERFATEGITTVSQLAYCDPIKVTIRTNLGYSYIVDCVSQALLWIYVEKDHEVWRKA